MNPTAAVLFTEACYYGPRLAIKPNDSKMHYKIDPTVVYLQQSLLLLQPSCFHGKCTYLFTSVTKCMWKPNVSYSVLFVRGLLFVIPVFFIHSSSGYIMKCILLCNDLWPIKHVKLQTSSSSMQPFLVFISEKVGGEINVAYYEGAGGIHKTDNNF